MPFKVPYNKPGQHSPDLVESFSNTAFLTNECYMRWCHFQHSLLSGIERLSLAQHLRFESCSGHWLPQPPQHSWIALFPGAYSMGFFWAGPWTDQTLLSWSSGLRSCYLPCSLLSGVILNCFNSILTIHLRLFKKASTINIKSLDTTSTKKVGLEIKGRQKVTRTNHSAQIYAHFTILSSTHSKKLFLFRMQVLFFRLVPIISSPITTHMSSTTLKESMTTVLSLSVQSQRC